MLLLDILDPQNGFISGASSGLKIPNRSSRIRQVLRRLLTGWQPVTTL